MDEPEFQVCVDVIRGTNDIFRLEKNEELAAQMAARFCRTFYPERQYQDTIARIFKPRGPIK